MEIEDRRDKRDPESIGLHIIGELNRTSLKRKTRKKATTVSLDGVAIRNYGESDDDYARRIDQSHPTQLR